MKFKKRIIQFVFCFFAFMLLPIFIYSQPGKMPILDSVTKQEYVVKITKMLGYLKANKVDSARLMYNTYKTYIKGPKDSTRNFYANYMQSTFCNMINKDDSAALFINEGIRYAINYQNYSMVGFAYLVKGKGLVNAGNPNDAIPFLKIAIKEFERLPISTNLVDAYVCLAKSYGNQNDVTNKLKYLHKGLENQTKALHSSENLLNEIDINLSLAKTYTLIKYDAKALYHANRAYQLTKNSTTITANLSPSIDILRYSPELSLAEKNILLKEGIQYELKGSKREYLKRFAFEMSHNFARMNQLDSGKYYYDLGKSASYQQKSSNTLFSEISSKYLASLYFEPDSSPHLLSLLETNSNSLSDSFNHRRSLANYKKNYFLSIKHMDSFNHYQNIYEDFDKKISGMEKTEITERLNVEFETERKTKEIDFLNKDNKLKQLEVTNSKINYTKIELENLKQKQSILINDLELKNKNKSLVLSQTERERKTQELLLVTKDIEAKNTQLALLQQSKQNQELITKQRLMEEENKRVKEKRNLWIGFLSALAILGLLILFWVQKMKQGTQRKSYEAVIQSIENERDRISADLHDDIGSTLSSISIYNELISANATSKPGVIPDLTSKIGVQIKDLMMRTEDIIWSLRKENHKNETIAKRVHDYVIELLHTKNISAEIKIEADAENMIHHPEHRKNILMMVKEAMNNCRKYSEASHFLLHIKVDINQLIINISDNGIGFNAKTITYGNGINNIKERCAKLGGTFTIKSESTKGTQIQCSIPIATFSYKEAKKLT